MKTIWKFPLKLTDKQTLHLPGAFQPLHVGLDPSGDLCLWAVGMPGTEVWPLDLYIVGTGHDIPVVSGLSHLGSVVVGPFVWHVFKG